MTGVLKDLPFAMAYLDNIIIYSSTPEEHLQHIKTVFEKLCHAKLSMKLSKCHFFAKEIQYLGHILGMEGIRPVPAKTEAIKAIHPQVNPKQVHAFLCKNSEVSDNANPHGRQIQMEGNTSLCFHETERHHHQSTHPQIPEHNKTLYHVYGHLR